MKRKYFVEIFEIRKTDELFEFVGHLEVIDDLDGLAVFGGLDIESSCGLHFGYFRY